MSFLGEASDYHLRVSKNFFQSKVLSVKKQHSIQMQAVVMEGKCILYEWELLWSFVALTATYVVVVVVLCV